MKHFATFADRMARKRGSRTAVMTKNADTREWRGITWAEIRAEVDCTAAALVGLGVREHDRVAICSDNMLEALYVDLACYAIRAVAVPMYPSLAEQQINYILRDADIRVACVGEQRQYDAMLSIMRTTGTSLANIIVFDNRTNLRGEPNALYFGQLHSIGQHPENIAVVESRKRAARDGDTAIIMYTSGTTGQPKGVVLSNENIEASIESYERKFRRVGSSDKLLSFLPMTHIFARINVYFCLVRGAVVYLDVQTDDIRKIMTEIHPTIVATVPRLWEKVYKAIEARLSTRSQRQQRFARWAMRVGEQYNLGYRRFGKMAPFGLWLKYRWADMRYFAGVRKAFGADQARLLPAAGAHMDPGLIKYFRSMGLPLVHAYGLTETTAAVSCYDERNYEIGSLGTLMPGVKVKIADDGEILVRGRSVTQGYYNLKDENSRAFADGWFRTGDAGRLVGNTLYMTDRIKDLFKTSYGKYVSPAQIESLLERDPYVDRAVAVGDDRNFVTALIAPNVSLLEQYAGDNNIKYDSLEQLLHDRSINDMLMARIEQLQSCLAQFEQVKRFRMVPDGFRVETGEVTLTDKVRRGIIVKRYQALVDEMYAD